MVQLAPAINKDYKSRREKIISWLGCLCRSLSSWVHVCWRTGGGASVSWVRVEITHIEEGDRTSVEANHNPEDRSHLGQYDV